MPKYFFFRTFSRVLAKAQYNFLLYIHEQTYIQLSLQTYKQINKKIRQHFFAFMQLFFCILCINIKKTHSRVDCLLAGWLVKGESLVQHFSFFYFLLITFVVHNKLLHVVIVRRLYFIVVSINAATRGNALLEFFLVRFKYRVFLSKRSFLGSSVAA